MKSPPPSLEAEIASAALSAVGQPNLPVAVRKRAALAPIRIGPRPVLKPRQDAELASEPFDISKLVEQVAPTIDADGRHYPQLTNVPRSRERELELALKDQWRELSARCIQIADLCNARQQQAAELQKAQTALSDLEQCVGLLHAALAQQEGETAAAKQALAQTGDEMAASRMQLEAARADAATSQDLARQLRAGFDQRGAALSAAQQKIDALAAALAAKTAEAEKLAAPIDEERRQHRDELTQQSVRFEIEIARLTRLLREREQQLETLHGAHTRVAKRYAELARSAESLESEKKTARDHVKAQAELIELLEALLKVERETAEGKIAELTAALAQERAARAEVEGASAAIRKNIVRLLPTLVARRAQEAAEAPGKREDAA